MGLFGRLGLFGRHRFWGGRLLLPSFDNRSFVTRSARDADTKQTLLF